MSSLFCRVHLISCLLLTLLYSIKYNLSIVFSKYFYIIVLFSEYIIRAISFPETICIYNDLQEIKKPKTSARIRSASNWNRSALLTGITHHVPRTFDFHLLAFTCFYLLLTTFTYFYLLLSSA